MPMPQIKDNQNELLLKRFQESVNALAQSLNARVALVTQITHKELLINAASSNSDNPFRASDTFALNANIFCLKVTKNRSPLLIFDHQRQSDNPDSKRAQLDYYGFPLFYPDGKLHGTICVKEAQPKLSLDQIKKVFEIFITLIESDFAYFAEQTNNEQQS